MPVYDVIFPKSAPGLVFTSKRLLRGSHTKESLIRVISTDKTQRSLTVEAKNEQIIRDTLKPYSGRYEINERESAAVNASPAQIPDMRDTKYLAHEIREKTEKISALESRVRELEGELSASEENNEYLNMELSEIKESVENPANLALSYFKGIRPTFFEVLAMLETYNNKGELQNILNATGKSFLEYANSLLEKEGLSIYSTELELKKDLDATAVSFEDLPENRGIIEEYRKAKETLRFIENAGKMTEIPSHLLDDLVAKCRKDEKVLKDKIAEHESKKKLHATKQNISRRFNNIEQEYNYAREQSKIIREKCTGAELVYALVSENGCWKLMLPFLPPHSQMWLSRQISAHAYESTRLSQPDQNSINSNIVQVPEGMSCKEVIEGLEVALVKYEFARFGLKPEVLVIYKSQLQVPTHSDANGKTYTIKEVAGMIGKSYSYVLNTLKKKAKDKGIKLLSKAYGQKRQLFSIPASELPNVRKLFSSDV